MRRCIAPVFSLLSLASAHGAVTSYTISGTKYPGYQGFSPASSPPTIQRQWPNYDPIMTVTDPKMTCNGGTSAALSAPVSAGANVTAHWAQWTHAQGPVMVWLYDCQGAPFSACDGSAERWVKIDQLGLWGSQLNSENWGTAIVLAQLAWTSIIPYNIRPGNYLIRHELLALHQENTPQFYPECAQIVISGDGDAYPPAELNFKIPAYASQSDPGVTVCHLLH
ncbi:related to cel1 protein precursor [Cephalotrichum gorgonifer]|uniref:lytic cellulose monooxygenase (C4-dehydrogenating) n=1 Tax=Cephalotrichum gorgonifer TaxID=2041049 RepID=A0AAE8SZU0_9PEZI|nr:related to cel1 protein precursor [Cephalotrichum gorgonifer]